MPSTEAKCKKLGVSPDFFFPVGPGGPSEDSTDKLEENNAKFCRNEGMFKDSSGPCPKMKECLEYALANNESGVYGGTTTKQRRKIIKKRKAA